MSANIKHKSEKYLGHFFAELLHCSSYFWCLHEIVDKFHNLSTLVQMPHSTSNRCNSSQSKNLETNKNHSEGRRRGSGNKSLINKLNNTQEISIIDCTESKSIIYSICIMTTDRGKINKLQSLWLTLTMQLFSLSYCGQWKLQMRSAETITNLELYHAHIPKLNKDLTLAFKYRQHVIKLIHPSRAPPYIIHSTRSNFWKWLRQTNSPSK